MAAKKKSKPVSSEMSMAQAFDEWMRMEKEEPARFQSCWQSALSHEREAEGLLVSEYGRDCTILLQGLMENGSDFWNQYE